MGNSQGLAYKGSIVQFDPLDAHTAMQGLHTYTRARTHTHTHTHTHTITNTAINILISLFVQMPNSVWFVIINIDITLSICK